MAEIKMGGKTRFENLLKQLFHSPLLDMMLALVGYFIPTRAHEIIVMYVGVSGVKIGNLINFFTHFLTRLHVFLSYYGI